MDIQLEKASIIKRIKNVNNESLIKTFKNLLDYAQEQEKDELLEISIDRGLSQSLKGDSRPHKEVMDEVREKYKV